MQNEEEGFTIWAASRLTDCGRSPDSGLISALIPDHCHGSGTVALSSHEYIRHAARCIGTSQSIVQELECWGGGNCYSIFYPRLCLSMGWAGQWSKMISLQTWFKMRGIEHANDILWFKTRNKFDNSSSLESCPPHSSISHHPHPQTTLLIYSTLNYFFCSLVLDVGRKLLPALFATWATFNCRWTLRV